MDASHRDSQAHTVRQPEREVDGLDWHARQVDEVESALDTSIEQGLNPQQVAERLERRGHNELEEGPRPGFYRMLLDQFNNFIVIVLLIAAALAAVLGDYIEAGAIMAIVVLNAALGVIQERRAEEALAALKKMAAPEADVIRDGRRQSIPTRELVPGDVVVLESGNFVPADLRLYEAVNLRVEEAALTGESVPVEKEAQLVLPHDVSLGDRRNAAFSGTMVAHGRGRGVVVATGMNTQIGMIASMLQSMDVEETPLQRRLDQLGKTLGWAALAVCGVVFVVGWMRGFDFFEMFLVAVSLAVAAVPEGLPAVVTITLALGMREMIKRHALIRRLASVETLGSTTVICSDKTGTLTENQMAVTRIWVDGLQFEVTGDPASPRGAFLHAGEEIQLVDYPALTSSLWAAALDNDAVLESDDSVEGGTQYRMIGDPTEAALIVAAAKAGAWRHDLERNYPRIDEIPFDSGRKRMTTIHRLEESTPEDASPFNDNERRGWEVAAVKGAPDVVLDLCSHSQTIDDDTVPMSEDRRQQILAANEAMAQDALRVLAVAFRLEEDLPDGDRADEIERNLTFIGLIGMIDPPRPEVAEAIETARRAGIRTVMITGDYPDTARAVAEQIGLLQAGHKVATGKDLSGFSDEQLAEEVQSTDVFARVSPEHKVRIVDALRANNHVVAMTGDGVNDAPALKRSDIGVAMGITGTDVAKETADMVLTDDNYASIVSAVEQGRIIYSNIRKFVFYLLSCNLAEILTILVAILVGAPSPLTAIQLLWLNLITDGAPALALGLEKGDPDTMDQPPRPPAEPIINRHMQIGIAVQTVAIAGVTLTAYFLSRQLYPGDQQLAETMAFATLSFSELLRAFTARSERYLLHRLGIFTNMYMVYAVVSSMVLLLLVIYVPLLEPIFDTAELTLAQWEIILPLLLVPSVVQEFTKWILARTSSGRPAQREAAIG
ncbi:MAG: cation-translocating P-type ATPase [Anaerolineales bacterium]